MFYGAPLPFRRKMLSIKGERMLFGFPDGFAE
jgi:hypothetical protein